MGIFEANIWKDWHPREKCKLLFFSSYCNVAQPKNVHLWQVKGMKFHSHTFSNANVGKALSLGKKIVLKFLSVEKSSKLNLFHKILPKKISQNVLWWEKREIYSDSHNSMENNVLSLIHIYNIITADREKEESICNQDLPLLLMFLFKRVLWKCYFCLAEDFSNTWNTFNEPMMKKITLYFKAVPAHRLWCLRVDGEWWQERVEFWFLL